MSNCRLAPDGMDCGNIKNDINMCAQTDRRTRGNDIMADWDTCPRQKTRVLTPIKARCMHCEEGKECDMASGEHCIAYYKRLIAAKDFSRCPWPEKQK